MLAVDLSDVFIDDTVSRSIHQYENFKNEYIPKAKDFDDDDSQFTTNTINSVTANNL